MSGTIGLLGTGLTFETSSFSGMTASGLAVVGTNANAQNVPEVDNFGAFYLNSTLATYSGTAFTLIISFTLPGSGAVSTTATLNGSVSGTNEGGVFIDFGNSPIHLSLAGGQSLDLSLAGVNVKAPNGNEGCPGAVATNTACAPITGHFVVTNPEPASAVLAGTGLLLLLGVARRVRRR